MTSGQRAIARRAAEATPLALLEFQSPTAAVIATPVPWSARGATWIVGSMVFAFIGVSGLIPIDKVVTAPGKVVADAATIVVQPLETAIVRQISVRPGMVVHAGDVLARLDPTFAGSDENALKAQVKSLTAEVTRLQAEMQGKPFTYTGLDPDLSLQAAIYAQRHAGLMYALETYRQKIAGLQSAIGQSEADVQGYAQRLVVARDVERMRVELQKDHVGSRLNTDAAMDNRLEVTRGLANAVAARDAAHSNLESAKNDRDAFERGWYSDTAQKMSDQTRALSDSSESLHKAELRRQLVELRADQDATVMTVAPVSVGSVMQSGDQFITMVPVDAPMAVEADIPGGDAGFVGLGDTVTVKFDTLPFAKYGTAKGTVKNVSPDAFMGNDPSGKPSSLYSGPIAMGGTTGGGMGGQGGAEPFYRGRMSLDQLQMHDLPQNFRVVPGMPVTADIKVGRRTLLTYLLQRVLPPAMDAMREPS